MHPYTQKYRPKIRKKPHAWKFIEKYLVKNYAKEHVRVRSTAQSPTDGDILEEGGDEKDNEEDQDLRDLPRDAEDVRDPPHDAEDLRDHPRDAEELDTPGDGVGPAAERVPGVRDDPEGRDDCLPPQGDERVRDHPEGRDVCLPPQGDDRADAELGRDAVGLDERVVQWLFDMQKILFEVNAN